jgi:hypothetical protein
MGALWGERGLDSAGFWVRIMRDAGYRMQDTGCRMQDAGYRMQDAGCRPRVRVFRNMNRESHPYPGFPFSVGYQVPGSRYRVLVPGTGYPAPDRRRRPDTEHRGPSRAPGTRYRVPATWHRVPGTGAGPTPRAGYRAPKTEPGPGSVPGTRPWRDEGQGRYNLLVSLVQAEGREPKAGHRTPAPGTCFYI